jgi:hypothetical protein
VWAQGKREVAKKYKILEISLVERLDNEELEKVTQVDWTFCVYHAVNVQDDYAKGKKM